MRLFPLILLAMLAVPMISTAEPVALPPGGWSAAFGRDHVLTGRIWDHRARRFIDRGALVQALVAAPLVILGEKHDLLDHHVLQAQLLQDLIAAGRRPGVAFEMLTLDQSEALAAHLASDPKDAAGLGAAVGWEARGWLPWSAYEPIAAAALSAGLPLAAADLSREARRRLALKGLDALFGPGERTALGLDRALPPDVQEKLENDLVANHCHMVPKVRIGPMLLAHRVRDAVMAKTMLALAGRPETDGAVLIAGAEHGRRDRSVPWAIRQQLAETPQGPLALRSMAFAVVDPEETDPVVYAQTQEGWALFDYVWFTPYLDREDPCTQFRDQLLRLKQGHEGRSG